MIIATDSFAQPKDAWVRYHNKSTDLYGYKDLKGRVRISPRFSLLEPADTFHNIIAVMEKAGPSSTYYLLRNGHKAGIDSVYISDFTFDCEQEGKIIYYDKKSDRIGFLDSNGAVIIPAVYNYAYPFHNGLTVALRNARRWCWDNNTESPTGCEHLGWKGGELVLINEQNEVLVDSFNIAPDRINWYSKKVNDASVDTGLYTTIVGTNNTTYSFIDFDKEFARWFYKDFIQSIQSTSRKLPGLLFTEVTYWSEEMGWLSLSRQQFLTKFPTLLRPGLFESARLKEVSIVSDDLNEYIFDKPIYRKYLTSCGAHDKSKYPVYDVMLTYYKKRTGSSSDSNPDNDLDYQDHFEFLRTEDGYRLLSVSVKQ